VATNFFLNAFQSIGWPNSAKRIDGVMKGISTTLGLAFDAYGARHCTMDSAIKSRILCRLIV
jgi:hypothetical protein